MGIFAVWIELPNDVTVQCSRHSDPGMHQEVPALSGADQAVDGSPAAFRLVVLGAGAVEPSPDEFGTVNMQILKGCAVGHQRFDPARLLTSARPRLRWMFRITIFLRDPWIRSTARDLRLWSTLRDIRRCPAELAAELLDLMFKFLFLAIESLLQDRHDPLVETP
jgi:hypothetical protein